MHCIGEVDRGRFHRKIDDIALGCKDEHAMTEEVGFERVEIFLRFFVAVFHPDYDLNPQTRNAKRGVAQRIEREDLGLKELRDLFAKKIWLGKPLSDQRAKYDPLVELIQQGRNGIHAFKNRELPTHDRFLAALSLAREMCDELDGRLPPA